MISEFLKGKQFIKVYAHAKGQKELWVVTNPKLDEKELAKTLGVLNSLNTDKKWGFEGFEAEKGEITQDEFTDFLLYVLDEKVDINVITEFNHLTPRTTCYKIPNALGLGDLKKDLKYTSLRALRKENQLDGEMRTM